MIIKKRAILNFLLIFFLLKPTGLDALTIIGNKLMNIFRLFSMLYILIVYFLLILRPKIKINNFLFLLIVMDIMSIVVCVFNDNSPYNAIVYWQSIISLIMLYEVNNNKSDFLNSVTLVLEIYVIFNFIYILLNIFNGSDILYFLLGQKNMIILYTFPLIFLEYYGLLFQRTNLFYKFMILVISFFTSFFVQSATSMIAYLILASYLFLKNNYLFINFFKKIKAKHLLFISVTFFILIIVFQIQNYAANFIVEFLGKDITFTGRTYIWENVINCIKSNPWGYGWDKNIYGVKSILIWENYTVVGHAHNFILNFAYKSGFFSSIVYIIILIMVSRKIDLCNNSKLNILSKIGFFTFLIITTFEAYPTNCICIFFILFLMSEISKKEIEVK